MVFVMICPNCGSEVKEGLVFCFNCGSKVDSVSVVKDEMPNGNSVENNHNSGLNIFKNNKHLDKMKKSSSSISHSTKEFVGNVGNSIMNFHSNADSDDGYEKVDYQEYLNYIRANSSSKIEFPANDKETENKLKNLLSGEVIGAGAGLLGAAASIGLIGTTLGAGLLIIGAGAFVGGVIANNYKNMSWVESELYIRDDELIFSGKFSLHYNEIKHVDVKTIDNNELLVLTLKDHAIEFRTPNSLALKNVIDEKMRRYYS